MTLFAEKRQPEKLTPAELDQYLEKGWYRMGQSIFTTHFLCFGNSFYSAMWVRLPLEGYKFSKSLSKNVKRNSTHFQTTIGPALITREQEALYHKYRDNFQGILSASLLDSLYDTRTYNLFHTMQVTVRDGDRLVACSFFDLGINSAASILGFYHPDYSPYSLGLYTMLEEIQYCQSRGMAWFYPGYVVPGYHRFDYKLRIGDTEYFDIATKSWLPWAGLTQQDTPIKIMERKLASLNDTLRMTRLPSRFMYYPLFEANIFGFLDETCVEFPVFLLCAAPPRHNGYVIVVYDVRDQQYKMVRCTPFEDFNFFLSDSFLQNFSPENYFLELILQEEILLESHNPEFIALALHKLRSLK